MKKTVAKTLGAAVLTLGLVIGSAGLAHGQASGGGGGGGGDGGARPQTTQTDRGFDWGWLGLLGLVGLAGLIPRNRNAHADHGATAGRM